jgi:hypothetical protein
VPTLAELREQAGLPAHSPTPLLVIEHMLAQSELPTRTTCAQCERLTDGSADATVECEKTWGGEPGLLSLMFALIFLPFLWFAAFLSTRVGERREYGRNLILHLPVRMCDGCQSHFARNALANGLHLGALLLVAAGLILLILWIPWGGLLLAAAVLLFFLTAILRKQRQTILKRLVRQEPMYERLLEDYPSANVVLNPTGKNT